MTILNIELSEKISSTIIELTKIPMVKITVLFISFCGFSLKAC